MKRRVEIEERAALYQEMIVETIDLRTHGTVADGKELDLLLLTMVDRLEALLWVLDELEDDLLDRDGPLH